MIGNWACSDICQNLSEVSLSDPMVDNIQRFAYF